MRAQPSREAAVLLDIPYGGRVLYVYEENITWEENTLTLPAYSIAVFTV